VRAQGFQKLVVSRRVAFHALHQQLAQALFDVGEAAISFFYSFHGGFWLQREVKNIFCGFGSSL
jgi:hypothetical protein